MRRAPLRRALRSRHPSAPLLRWLLSGVVLALVIVAPSLAFAQSTAAKFAQAVDLFVEDKCDEALPIFREVHAKSESPNARLYIARCLQKIGDLPSAYNEMKGTVADASARAAAEPKYAETRNAAAAELAQLEPRVARVVVGVADAPEGVTAELNGKPAPIGQPFAVAPGAVTVVVRAPGRSPIERKVEVRAGKTKTVALSLDDESDDPLPEPDPEPTPDSAGPGFGTLRIAGIAVAGLGLVGVVIFAVTGSAAQSEFDELSELCNDTTCPDSEAERVADGRTLTTVANVSLIIGIAAVLGGTAMVIFGGESATDEDPSTEALRVVPFATPLPGGAYAGLGGSF